MEDTSERIIGCIDGSLLHVVTDNDEVSLHFDGRVARISLAAAKLLANTLNPDDTRRAKVPMRHSRRGGGSSRMGAPVNPSVLDLVDKGYLTPGEILSLHHLGNKHSGVVRADGQIEVDGVANATLSAAAAFTTGVTLNGWQVWRLDDGSLIDSLRWHVRADEFPGEGHQLAATSANEKRMIAKRWVQHALEKGLDPSVQNDSQINLMLGAKNYAASTINNYKLHLNDWFKFYSKKPLLEQRSNSKQD